MFVPHTGHPSNKPCLDYFSTASIAPAVAAVYGAELTTKVALAHAYWLLQLGRVPDLWKQTQPYTAGPPAQPLPAPVAKGKPAATAVAAIETVCIERATAILQVQETNLPISCLNFADGHFVAQCMSLGCNPECRTSVCFCSCTLAPLQLLS